MNEKKRGGLLLRAAPSNGSPPSELSDWHEYTSHSVPCQYPSDRSCGQGSVLDGCGWPRDLSDEDILERLLVLNLERARTNQRRRDRRRLPGTRLTPDLPL